MLMMVKRFKDVDSTVESCLRTLEFDRMFVSLTAKFSNRGGGGNVLSIASWHFELIGSPFSYNENHCQTF